MKIFVLLIAAFLSLSAVNAQYSQDFESQESALTGNCWTLTDVSRTTNVDDVISGIASMITSPPTSGSSRDLATPALNITSSSLTVSFKYKLSDALNGNATRTINIGLLNSAGTFTSLAVISLDKNSPETVLNFNQTFSLASTGNRNLVLKTSGSNGDGNSRLIFDDLYVSASPLYGAGTCNTAPVAVNDMYSGMIGSVITGNILSNDNDANGETITPSIVATSPDGLVVVNPLGLFTFTPALGFLGPQTTFTYQVTDNGLNPMSSNIATVTLNYQPNIPLPVKLISFTATRNNNKADLKWTTSSEINVSHFVIEKSTDGINFHSAGVLFANGNANDKTHYTFSDNLTYLTETVVFYRLRSIDIDGKSQYSETRLIRLGISNDNTLTILTFPNPVTNELKVTIPSTWQNKPVRYEIYSMNGQVVSRIQSNNSSQTETLNTSKLSPGMYIIKAVCEDASAYQRIVKQ